MLPLRPSPAPWHRVALFAAALALPLAGCSSAAPSSAPAASSASAPATSASAPPTSASASASPSATPSSPSPSPSAAGYSMAEVKKHAGAASCWTVIDKNVYDLTKWVNRHPGGRARILQLCGRDGTAAFRDEHGSESRPNKILAGYELGPLS